MPDDPPQKARAQQILDAAERLLAEGGCASLSAQAVAKAAGVNKALVFYYFGGTAELLQHVLQRYYARHKQALAAGFSAQGSPSARVHALIDAYLDYIEGDWAYARIVQEQVAGRGPHLPLVQTHLVEMMKWATSEIEPLTGRAGPTGARHFFLSLSAIVINYFTYSAVLGKEGWGRDPSSRAAVAERREHVHWVVDAWLEKLAREAPTD